MTVGYCKPMLPNIYTLLFPLQTWETCRMIWLFQVLSECLVQDVQAGYIVCRSSVAYFTWFLLSSEPACNATFRVSTPVSGCLHLGSYNVLQCSKVCNKNSRTASWLRWTVSGFSPSRCRFNPGSFLTWIRFEIQL